MDTVPGSRGLGDQNAVCSAEKSCRADFSKRQEAAPCGAGVSTAAAH